MVVKTPITPAKVVASPSVKAPATTPAPVAEPIVEVIPSRSVWLKQKKDFTKLKGKKPDDKIAMVVGNRIVIDMIDLGDELTEKVASSLCKQAGKRVHLYSNSRDEFVTWNGIKWTDTSEEMLDILTSMFGK